MDRLDIYLYMYLEINKSELIGAKMSFYECDTNNFIDSFTDSSGEILHTNPVLADANGRFPKIYIKKPYKVVIHSSISEHIFEDSYS